MKSSLYVPYENRDSNSRKSQIEFMHVKLVKSLNDFHKEIRAHILGASQKFESHATTIKKIKKQLGLMSTSLSQRYLGTLPSNSIQNSENNCHYLAITTRISQMTADTSMPMVFENEIKTDCQ